MLRYLRTLYILWSLVWRQVTRRLTRLQTMRNVLKYSKKNQNGSLRLRFGCGYLFNLLMFSTVSHHLWIWRGFLGVLIVPRDLLVRWRLCDVRRGLAGLSEVIVDGIPQNVALIARQRDRVNHRRGSARCPRLKPSSEIQSNLFKATIERCQIDNRCGR